MRFEVEKLLIFMKIAFKIHAVSRVRIRVEIRVRIRVKVRVRHKVRVI